MVVVVVVKSKTVDRAYFLLVMWLWRAQIKALIHRVTMPQNSSRNCYFTFKENDSLMHVDGAGKCVQIVEQMSTDNIWAGVLYFSTDYFYNDDEMILTSTFLMVRRRHTLSRKRIVPLPVWKANPETDPGALFTKGTVSIVVMCALALKNQLRSIAEVMN